jgi:hypothetical protein
MRRRISYDITDSKPPRQVPSPYGGKDTVESVFGAVKATAFDRQSYSLEGRLDPREPDVLTGTKTVKSDDGKEETIIKWHLTRCTPIRKSPVPSAKKK